MSKKEVRVVFSEEEFQRIKSGEDSEGFNLLVENFSGLFYNYAGRFKKDNRFYQDLMESKIYIFWDSIQHSDRIEFFAQQLRWGILRYFKKLTKNFKDRTLLANDYNSGGEMDKGPDGILDDMTEQRGTVEYKQSNQEKEISLQGNKDIMRAIFYRYGYKRHAIVKFRLDESGNEVPWPEVSRILHQELGILIRPNSCCWNYKKTMRLCKEDISLMGLKAFLSIPKNTKHEKDEEYYFVKRQHSKRQSRKSF